MAQATIDAPPDDTKQKSPIITIDVSGLPCPAPLLGAKKILDDLQPGQRMCLISDCPGTYDDLSAWCRFTGHALISPTTRSHGMTVYLLCKSGKQHTSPIPHVTLDMRGVACPGPILEARKLLHGMRSGEVLQLTTDCTAAIDEVPSWSREAAIDLLLALELADGTREFYLQKA